MILTIKVDTPPWMAEGVKEEIAMRLEGLRRCANPAYGGGRAHATIYLGRSNKMIHVEGFKAFRGTMRITPKCSGVAPFELTGDWLYKPDAKCWYGCGRSFGADICVPMEDA